MPLAEANLRLMIRGRSKANGGHRSAVSYALLETMRCIFVQAMLSDAISCGIKFGAASL
jgi:hypothetical protein